jgi:tyrosyl-tRNA synthetase
MELKIHNDSFRCPDEGGVSELLPKDKDMSFSNEDKIAHLLTHRVDEVIVRESLESRLKSGRQLRIKLGADPSRPDLHLGHAVVLGKLKEFQELGHQVVFLIGDFTARIGDPSGKSKTRPMLSDEEIKQNAATYFRQVGKVLDMSKCEIRYNSEWLSTMTAGDFLSLASKFTVARILERDDFTNRFQNKSDIYVHGLTRCANFVFPSTAYVFQEPFITSPPGERGENSHIA